MATYNFKTNVAQTLILGRTSSVEIKGTFDSATFTLTGPGGTTAIRTPNTVAEIFKCGMHKLVVTPSGGGASLDVDVIVLPVGDNDKYPS